MMRNSVVLPHPDGPTSAATSPFATVSESQLAQHMKLPPEAAR